MNNNEYIAKETNNHLQSAKHHEKEMRVLIMTSVSAEQEAILRGIQHNSRFDVRLAGVGPAAAAANTAFALANEKYDLVVSAGICGGFADQAELGSIVVADEIIFADLGAESPEGFLSLDELGFGSNRVQTDAYFTNLAAQGLRQASLPCRTGPILTVATVTGTAETTLELAKRVPNVAAEAMEGYGVAMAAQIAGVPILEIRAVSNAVGPRDRSAWRIKEALQALEAASSVLQEVL